MPYLSIRSVKPLLPIPVCFEPSIAINVPSGNDALVSGTNVTLVRSPKGLVKVAPCFALLPIDQPSFAKRLISCLPESTGAIRTLGYQSGDTLNMRAVECLSSYRSVDSDIFRGSCWIILNGMFLKESFSLANILQSIQVKQGSFLNSFLSLWNRTTKCSRTKFFTIGYPPSMFFSELISNDNITNCWHIYLFFRLKQAFSVLMIFQPSIILILPFVKRQMQISTHYYSTINS